MKLGEKISNAIRPDAQAFDEIRIITVPRYKQSGLSGDEWRISANILLYRKGKMVHSESFHDVDTCVNFLPFVIAQAKDNGKAFYAGEYELCDQEGCKELATTYLKIKKEFCCGWGGCGTEKKQFGEKYRKFCGAHKQRGDCGLEDADSNYEEIPRP